MSFHWAVSSPITKNTSNIDSLSHCLTSIDYHAVQEQLERASRPPLLKRLVKIFSIPLHSEQSITNRYWLRFMPAYNSDIGWYLRSSFEWMYSPSKTSVEGGLSLSTDISVRGSYRIGVAGRHKVNDRYKLSYRFLTYSLPIYFWGVGYTEAVDAVSLHYRRRESMAYAEVLFRLHDSLFCGPLVVARIADGCFDGQTTSAAIVEIGAALVYDSRNSEYNSERGIYLRMQSGVVFDCREKVKPSYHSLISFRGYVPLWKNGVWASEFYGEFMSHDVPWLFWATMDGVTRLRGYRYGRYIDRCMMSLQSELRQPLFGRFSAAVWGGVGVLFARWSDVRWRNLLPSYGLGLRIKVGDMGRVRFDCGFGRRSSSIAIAFNEAF